MRVGIDRRDKNCGRLGVGIRDFAEWPGAERGPQPGREQVVPHGLVGQCGGVVRLQVGLGIVSIQADDDRL